jgi:hypothetical protein
LPVSVAMFIASAAGSRLSARFPVCTIVRAGLGITILSIFMILGTVDRELDATSLAVSMAVLGLGMGAVN